MITNVLFMYRMATVESKGSMPTHYSTCILFTSHTHSLFTLFISIINKHATSHIKVLVTILEDWLPTQISEQKLIQRVVFPGSFTADEQGSRIHGMNSIYLPYKFNIN